ncbi:uncharacterized protein Pyn_16635 [Prunus yedoensis var. nudiflora]|uniref:Uncharacterized protein n=1 Tax=Prunus yedoensis var. nudiflora TaxID=2094558 RepID=A0A314XWC7_PRUYE|nr:uncharacterized protein Pyn_16635 [Prunus yedoensis var. nudiflora]
MAKRKGAVHLNGMLYHCSEESHGEPMPREWLVNISDGSIIMDDRIEHRMLTFKSLAREFIGSPLVQQTLKNDVVALSDYTAPYIWTGTLEEVLNGLKTELEYLDHQCPSKGTKMGQQIVASCLKFLADTSTSISYEHDSSSWTRLSPAKVTDSSGLQKWEDVLEMFNDLVDCLKNERELLLYVAKLEVLKEGLSQIKDVLTDRSIGHKEVRHQESLVQKKLTKTLGHSSRCLFTLLLYYLFGHVRDIEVDVCGGVYSRGSGNDFCLCMGRIVTSDEEEMVWSGVRQLDRALGLFKFVWETAGMKGALQLQGHIWCVGAEGRTLTYRGNTFFVHGIHV